MDFRLTHVRLLVSDFAACFEFYRDALGLEVKLRTEGDVYAEFQAGETILALYDRGLMSQIVGGPNRPAGGGDRAALTFAVEDVDRACRQLKEKGVEFVAPPADRREWFLRTAHLRDPEGNLIEINAPLEG